MPGCSRRAPSACSSRGRPYILLCVSLSAVSHDATASGLKPTSEQTPSRGAVDIVGYPGDEVPRDHVVVTEFVMMVVVGCGQGTGNTPSGSTGLTTSSEMSGAT